MTTTFSAALILAVTMLAALPGFAQNGARLAIDTKAQTVAHSELDIMAPPAAVWAVLTGIDRWTTWMPEFSAARLDGPLAPGSTIYWEPYGTKVASRIVAVDKGRKLIWNGTDGAVHVWELIPSAKGTLLRNSESIDHWQAAQNGRDGSAMLAQLLSMWNQRIADQARRQGG